MNRIHTGARSEGRKSLPYRAIHFTTGEYISANAVISAAFVPLPMIISIPQVIVPGLGVPQVGQMLMATTGLWTNAPTGFSYQWYNLSNGLIPSATMSTYVPVPGDAGSQLAVSVVASNYGGSSLPSTSVATPAVATAAVPMNTVLPAISPTGAVSVGQPLTVSNGTWSNLPTSFTYQWNRAAPTPDIINFAAASGSTFTISASPFSSQNANKAWSITNPDSQTLIFQVQPGDQWAGDPAGVERSEVAGVMFTPGTEVNVEYNFAMTSPTVRSSSTFFMVGKFHNDDVTLGGSTGSPFEIDLQPNDQMQITIGWLTANPSSVATASTATVNGVNISFGFAFQDSVNIIRGHNYNMQIQCKMHPTAGVLHVWRDGIQIVNYVGPLGFNFNTYWKYGIYRAAGADTQTAQYQNMVISSGPLVLGTAPTYAPVAGDAGLALEASVVASNSAGPSLPALSAASGNVIAASAPVINTPASIPGIPSAGHPITAIDAIWNNGVTSTVYRWQSGGVNATGVGANTLTYTPVIADIGNTLTITVTASNGSGTSLPSTSAPSAVVTGIVLQALQLSAASFTVGSLQGTLVGTVLNTTSGSTITFDSLSVAGSLQLALVSGSWKLQVGPSAPGVPGTITFNLVETLASAVNSPLMTTGFSVIENAAAPTDVLNIGLNITTDSIPLIS